MIPTTWRHNSLGNIRWLVVIVVLGLFSAAGCSQGGPTPDPLEQAPSPPAVAEVAATASAGTCATSWKAAELELGRPNFPSLADDVARVGKASSIAGKLRLGWGWLRAACSLSPKIC